MNQNFENENDDLDEEYDFTQLKVVRRGSGRMPKQTLVELDPDVAEKFPNAQAVNEALRFLIRVTQEHVSKKL